MKKVYLILSIVLLLGLTVVVFIGCGGDDGVTTAADPTEACMVCHAGDSDGANSDAILAAGAQYENSGHYLGPRTLDPNEDYTGHMFVHHGSNAMYTNGNPCAYCHTHQGFVDYVDTGSAGNYGAASQPGCFTCHDPHTSGTFGLRTTAAVTLETGDTFNLGDGNLCATCHLARDTVTTEEWDDYSLFPQSLSSHGGPHHGPHADMLLGVNGADFGYTGGTNAASSHAIGDSCVTCHLYQPSGRLGGTLALGGHGMYLKGDVHGSYTEVDNVCASCHSTGVWDWDGFTNATSTHIAPQDWDGDGGSPEAYLAEIKGMRDTLIAYFGAGANFPLNGGGAGDGLLISATTTGLDVVGGEWNKDWAFTGATTTMVQAMAFWNFKYFIEDKSDGIHHPKFAAQLLWDALKAINATTASVTVAGTRP